MPRGPERTRKYPALFLLASCGVVLSACGAQGPPVPPRVEQPVAVADLSVVQVGRSLVLRFTPPQLATDGERLTKPLEIQVLRAVYAGGGSPAAAEPAYEVWMTLLPDALPGGEGPVRHVIRLSDDELARLRSAALALAVRSLTRSYTGRGIVSELSNVVHARVLDVSGPVEDLRAQATETAVELTWSPPEDRSLAPAGFRVYRSRTGAAGPFEQVAEVAGAVFRDRDFAFGRTLHYKVRAVFRDLGQEAEGEDSPAVEITPRDLFPPAAPENLAGLYTSQAVELIWRANSETDLGGYFVYRRGEQAGFARLTDSPVATPLYRDESVEHDRSYVYRVTAVDLAGNESPPSNEVTVETR